MTADDRSPAQSVTGGRLAGIPARDDAEVTPALIPQALTAGELVFADGATQVFGADGSTTYVEHGRYR
jgi:hypothetical protein